MEAATILLTGTANWDDDRLINESMSKLKRRLGNPQKAKIILLDDPQSKFNDAVDLAKLTPDWTVEKYRAKTVFDSNAEWRTHRLLSYLHRANRCIAFYQEGAYDDLQSMICCVDAANAEGIPVEMITAENSSCKRRTRIPVYSKDLQVDSTNGTVWTLREIRVLSLRWVFARMLVHVLPAIACAVLLGSFSNTNGDPLGVIGSLPLLGAVITFIWDWKVYWPHSPVENSWEIPPDLWGLKSEQICTLFQRQPRLFVDRFN